MERSLIAGDVVKRSAQDSMSGTVVQTHTSVALLKPQRWPSADVQIPLTKSDFRRAGNYIAETDDMFNDVPTTDLVWANKYHVDHFVIYKDWIGMIVNRSDDIYVRLSNNSVVIPEDQDELSCSSVGDALGDTPAVGDFVQTTKSNLRRGRWIYGAYNADIEPHGCIADIRTIGLEVDWLCSKFANWSTQSSMVPPSEIDLDLLESGEILVYDSRRLTRDGNNGGANSPVPSPALRRLDLDLFVGDTVRFRDLAGAAVKYNPNRTSPDGTSPNCSFPNQLQQHSFERIPRTDSLGFDINVFKVVGTKTIATVLWQDLTTSELPSIELIPHLDADGENEHWPGELVANRKVTMQSHLEDPLFRVGIIQRVNAADRVGKVKWFTSARLSFLWEELEGEPLLLPESITGPLSEEAEDVSLYEIWSMPGLATRIGDFVTLQPCVGHKDKGIDMLIYDHVEALLEITESVDWFGEVVELGLDGLVTIRLAASSRVRDIRVPWECTYLVHSSDFEDDEDDDFDTDMEDETSEDTDTDTDSDMPELVEVRGPDGEWRNMSEVGDEDMEDWTTDEEEDYAASDSGSQGSNSVNNEERDTDMVEAEEESVQPSRNPSPPLGHNPRTPFSYGSMFDHSNLQSPSQKPEQFIVLDTQPPQDHHYSDRTPSNSPNRIKRLQREYQILQNSLPDGVYVRTWESALDLLRVIILGPIDTPYEYAPFVIDLYLDSTFPIQPPKAYFHSWTGGAGPINPNLYEDGNICLSLLGTWPGDERNETWSSTKSTVLQLLVSLVGLVLVKEPFYSKSYDFPCHCRCGDPSDC